MKTDKKLWKTMKTDENRWKPIETNGNQWKPMKTDENQCKPMKTDGNQWKPMKTTENRWKPIETNENQWKPINTNGFQWKPMTTSENQAVIPLLSAAKWSKKQPPPNKSLILSNVTGTFPLLLFRARPRSQKFNGDQHRSAFWHQWNMAVVPFLSQAKH